MARPQVSGAKVRLHGLRVEGQVLPELGGPRDPPREIRDRPRLRPPVHLLRVQSEGSGAPKESGDALRPPQTHPRPGSAPITWPMWRPGRVYPRSHRPKPSETSKTQALGTGYRMTSGTVSDYRTKIGHNQPQSAKSKRVLQRNQPKPSNAATKTKACLAWFWRFAAGQKHSLDPL